MGRRVAHSSLLFGLSGAVSIAVHYSWRQQNLLISEPPRATLADALKSLKQGVSRRLIGQAEHFWQKRYYDFNIRNREQFVEKLHRRFTWWGDDRRQWRPQSGPD